MLASLPPTKKKGQEGPGGICRNYFLNSMNSKTSLCVSRARRSQVNMK
jgi:hypothetical protein